VKVVMREVSQIRALRSDCVRSANSFGNTHVSWMKRAEERVEHENFRSFKQINHIVGNRFRVSYVREASNAIPEYLNRSVWNRKRQHVDARNLGSFPVAKGNRAAFGFGCSWQSADGIVEDVGKPVSQPLEGISGAVHLQRRVTTAGDCAYVVQSVCMIGVIVRVQDGIDTIYSRGNELKPELRRRIDQKPRAFHGFHDRTNPVALVAWIRRVTYGASASNLRDAKTRSGAEESELHADTPKPAVTRFPLSRGWSFRAHRTARRP
jgi:hypothetical protein